MLDASTCSGPRMTQTVAAALRAIWAILAAGRACSPSSLTMVAVLVRSLLDATPVPASYCPSINGIFRPMPAFSLFAILDVEGLRLRLRNRCGLGLNRNLPLLDGH